MMSHRRSGPARPAPPVHPPCPHPPIHRQHQPPFSASARPHCRSGPRSRGGEGARTGYSNSPSCPLAPLADQWLGKAKGHAPRPASRTGPRREREGGAATTSGRSTVQGQACCFGLERAQRAPPPGLQKAALVGGAGGRCGCSRLERARELGRDDGGVQHCGWHGPQAGVGAGGRLRLEALRGVGFGVSGFRGVH